MIGIYALYWEEPQLVYVGLTTTNRRFKEHCSNMIKGAHSNYKIQNTYNKYGLPSFTILELTTNTEELNILEIGWIKEFNSVEDGLNISHGGGSDSGLQASGSKHSKITILKVFSMLYSSTITQADISRRTNVPKPTIAKIAIGNSHLWLLEQYPAQYKQMLESNILRNKLNRKGGISGKVYPTLLGPTGEEYNISNVKGFCRDHPLLGVGGYTGLAEVFRGNKLQHKGFTLKDPIARDLNLSKPTLYGPENEEYNNITIISKFCHEHPLLSMYKYSSDSIARVFRGDQKEYLGFHL